jgi:hypothetical protein
MIANVMDVLKPLTARRLDGIEELAARLAAGATPPAEEVAAILERSRCTPDDLQRAVTRHARVAEIRSGMAQAAADRKRYAEIQAEIRPLDVAAVEARKKLDEALRRHWEEEMTLRHRIESADRERDALLRPENLPPGDAERLKAATARADAADAAVTAAQFEVTERRRRLRLAEEELPRAEERARFAKGNDDAQAAVVNLKSAVKARGEQLAAAEKTLAAAVKDDEAAKRDRDATRAALAKSVGMTQ